MKIQNLDLAATQLHHTPIELNNFGQWDTPKQFSDFYVLSFLFPVGYQLGEIVLQEGFSLSNAIETTKGCQAFDGGGCVWAIIRQKQGGRKVKRSPWGSPNAPQGGESLEVPTGLEIPVPVQVQK